MEPLIETFIKATGWSILHSFWQGALIYGILLIILSGFPKLRSGIRHNLAYLAQCLIFIGFCITFYISFNLPEKPMSLSATPLGLVYYVNPYASELPVNWSIMIEAIFPYIVSLYGVGLAAQALVLFSGYRKIQILKHSGRIPVPQDWALVFEEIKSALKIGRDVRFYLSSTVNVPLVIGYFKPVILFPVVLATQMDLKQVEAILIHEISHIRRNDYLLNLIKTIMETALFFNPFIWLSGKFIDMEREHACDDLVLKHTGTPMTYAHALLKLELLKNNSALSMAATGKTQYLYQRIKRITDMKTNYMNTKQRLIAMSLLLATAISLAWVSPIEPKLTVSKMKQKITTVTEGSIFEPVQIISDQVRNEILTVPVQDTTKKKTKIRIVTTDEKGNTREYNSLKEMPDSLRREVMVRVMPGPSRSGIHKDSLIFFHKEMFPRRFKMELDSIRSGKLDESIRKQVEDMARYYQSPEWKSQMEGLRKHAQDAAKHAKDMNLHLNLPEFRTEMRELHLNGEKLREKFNSEEWKKELEELKKFRESKEYKELIEKQRKELEKLQKKKGINTKLDTRVVTVLNTILPPPPPANPSAKGLPVPPAPPIR